MKIISLRHFMMTAAFSFAALSVNAATSLPSLPNDGSYMILKKLPMQEIADADMRTDTSTLTLVEVLSTEPSLSTLATAIKATDLKAILLGAGPYTIFAPNDAAFAKLSPDVLSDLLKPENKDQLAALLAYHVIPGKVEASDIKTGKVTASNGVALTFRADANGVSVNNAHIMQKNIPASNGVVHIIDAVLIP